jgi:hypothetical protein
MRGLAECLFGDEVVSVPPDFDSTPCLEEESRPEMKDPAEEIGKSNF